MLEIHLPWWAAVADVAREGCAEVRQHHANLMEAAGMKLDKQVALVGNAGHGSDQNHIEKRRLPSRPDDPH